MKVLIHKPAKCTGCGTCMRTCAKAFFKTEDVAFASLKITPSDTLENVYECNVCNQCGECIDVCPIIALKRSANGTVRVDSKICVGCYMCIGFCPTLSMFSHPDHNIAFKCSACGICVKACPEGALEIIEVPTPVVEPVPK